MHLAPLLLLLENKESKPAFITADQSDQLSKLFSKIHPTHLKNKQTKGKEKNPNPWVSTNSNLISSSSMSKEIVNLKKHY